MKKKTIKKYALVLSLTATAGMLACSKKKSDEVTETGYNGPGSYYTASMKSNGEFLIKKYETVSSSATTFEVVGNSSVVNGFRKLNVTSVSGTGGPSVGATLYGLEVPGLALFVQPPASGSDQVVAAVASGTCPSSSLNANWVIVKQSSSSNVSSSSQDIFGTFVYSGGVAGIGSKYSLTAPTTNLGTQTFSSATCSNGIMSVSTGGGGTATMYLTSGGGAIVNTAEGDSSNSSYIFGLPQASVSGANLSDKVYSGFVYMGSASSGNKFKPVKFSNFSWSGSQLSGTGSMLSDPSTDTTSAGSVSLTLSAFNSPSTGFMTGTLTTTGGTTAVACVGVENAGGSGKVLINCAGADPGDNTKLFNFMLVSR